MNKVLDRSETASSVAATRTRLLVVSSYHRSCGIAQYVEALEGPLRLPGACEVEIAPLPVDLLRSQSPYARQAADTQFAEIVELARLADVVNIQLEPGLFGSTPSSIWKRLSQLLSVSRRVIITYHTVPAVQTERLRPTLRGILGRIRSIRSQYVFARLFAAIRRDPGKFHHIVQTSREAQLFTLLGIPAGTISHHPLALIGAAERAAADHATAKRTVAERYQLADRKLIGCFGFLSRYKGVEVAIRALRHLPDDVHLLIVGGLHPEGIQLNTVEQPYINQLVAETRNYQKRVHFTGALNEEEFREMLNACDAVLLPYAEVGQTSSSPAAMALDLERPVYCSRTPCFLELERYGPGMLSFFEIGNHVELAEKLNRDDAGSAERIAARARYVSAYNVETRAQMYLDAAAGLMRT